MSAANALKAKIAGELSSIQKALLVLKHSYDSCRVIGIKDSYSLAELDQWEAFTSRFARASDLATQKIINSIMIFEKGQMGSIRDKASFCVKNELVKEEDDFINLPLTRNFIAHEYARQDTNEVFNLVWGYYPILVKFIEATVQYGNTKILYWVEIFPMSASVAQLLKFVFLK